jgi:hypothetical protein
MAKVRLECFYCPAESQFEVTVNNRGRVIWSEQYQRLSRWHFACQNWLIETDATAGKVEPPRIYALCPEHAVELRRTIEKAVA